MIEEVSFSENIGFLNSGNDHLAFAISHVFMGILFLAIAYLTFLILVWLCTDCEHD